MFAPRTWFFWGTVGIIAFVMAFTSLLPKVAGALLIAGFCGWPFILFEAAGIVGLWGIFDKSVMHDPWQATCFALLGLLLGFGPGVSYLTDPYYRAYFLPGGPVAAITLIGVILGFLIVFAIKKFKIPND